MKSFNLFLFFLIMTSFSVSSKNVTVYGGLYDCKLWTELTQKENEEKDQIIKNMINGRKSFWLAGYMTAFNQITGEDNFPMMSISISKEFIDDYCMKNISKDVIDGLLEMSKKIKK
ncbi:hypothetical protein [Yersinia rohdei]|uniref:Uncharacterized protein n=1 Tax=Yersinia rohdei TaxID=29485 RepID=A0A0U1HUL9_YERRO|nr:hypothetical protein [Yersinia rohdei]CQI91509.1 Uncharacterised protein [Yersinia rohdei]